MHSDEKKDSYKVVTTLSELNNADRPLLTGTAVITEFSDSGKSGIKHEGYIAQQAIPVKGGVGAWHAYEVIAPWCASHGWLQLFIKKEICERYQGSKVTLAAYATERFVRRLTREMENFIYFHVVRQEAAYKETVAEIWTVSRKKLRSVVSVNRLPYQTEDLRDALINMVMDYRKDKMTREHIAVIGGYVPELGIEEDYRERRRTEIIEDCYFTYDYPYEMLSTDVEIQLPKVKRQTSDLLVMLGLATFAAAPLALPMAVNLYYETKLEEKKDVYRSLVKDSELADTPMAALRAQDTFMRNTQEKSSDVLRVERLIAVVDRVRQTFGQFEVAIYRLDYDRAGMNVRGFESTGRYQVVLELQINPIQGVSPADQVEAVLLELVNQTSGFMDTMITPKDAKRFIERNRDILRVTFAGNYKSTV